MIRWLSGSRWRNALQTLTWKDVDLSTGVVSFARLKRDETGRSIVVADEVLRLFKRLHEIRFDDCDWVFPSRRRIDGERGHLDNALDRLALTCAGDLRHFWMTSAREVAPRHVHRWLAQQTMTDDDLQMLGHYGEPTREEQKATANAIASHILKRLRRAPTNVVEIERVTAYLDPASSCRKPPACEAVVRLRTNDAEEPEAAHVAAKACWGGDGRKGHG